MNKLSSGHIRHHSQLSQQRLHACLDSHMNKSNIGSAFQAELAKDLTEDLEN
ncbi:MAG: hypothetical protein FWF59_00780 [Turicibacter sp.]|nr:hypothetical protein [Turicibacter sp.]